MIYCIYELQYKDGSTIDVITSGVGLSIDVAYEITKSKRLNLISDVLTVTSYINGTNDMYADINSLTHMKNNYSITIELQNAKDRTVFDFVYQFDSIDQLYFMYDAKTAENTINNPNLINSYIVNPNNISDLFYPTGWSETIVD